MIEQIAKNVYWVGVVDWGLRHFHGHELSTHRGSSYNAYLIVDEKVALVDTVWTPFVDQLVENIRQVIDPARIDYVIANHSEVDHSGGLPEVMRLAPKAQLIVSKRGAESIPGHYHQTWNARPVKTGDTLPLGECELAFIEAPMLHWPDSMFTYVKGRNLLLPNDAFGQHYATDFRFNDQVDAAELMQEALKYYVNIINPYGEQVTRKIKEVLAMNLPIDMIAPSHGVLWRTNPTQIVEKYLDWAAQKPKQQAVILFDTMWNATRRMAEAIGDGLTEEGVHNKLFHMAVSDRNDVLAEIHQARAVVLGSPSLNRGVLPTMRPIMEDLRGLGFKNKVGAAFGSYGWSGECVKIIEEHFGLCGIPLVAPGVLAKWQPTADDLAKCKALGKQVAAAVKAAG